MSEFASKSEEKRVTTMYKEKLQKLQSANADLQRRLDEALKIIEDSRKQEPSVYILPSVLRQCEATEMNAHVYSVSFSNPEESSVPLYKEPIAAKIQDGNDLLRLGVRKVAETIQNDDVVLLGDMFFPVGFHAPCGKYYSGHIVTTSMSGKVIYKK